MQDVVLKGMAMDYRSSEAYKTLRTNIEFSGADKKVIVFTSCTAGEGKSTVSLSVASSLAEGGKKSYKKAPSSDEGGSAPFRAFNRAA